MPDGERLNDDEGALANSNCDKADHCRSGQVIDFDG